jgi:hypothetical protein
MFLLHGAVALDGGGAAPLPQAAIGGCLVQEGADAVETIADGVRAEADERAVCTGRVDGPAKMAAVRGQPLQHSGFSLKTSGAFFDTLNAGCYAFVPSALRHERTTRAVRPPNGCTGEPAVTLTIPLRRHMRRRTLARRIEANIRAGIGLYGQEWVLDQFPVAPRALSDLAEKITTWCAETMATTRRPYGIDQMALALAGAHPGSEPMASAGVSVFRPLEFYQPGGQRERIADFVASLDVEQLNRTARPVRIAATLFSWGDVARAALPTD